MQYRFRMALCEVRLRAVKSKKEAAEIEKAFELGSEPSPPIPVGIVDFLRQNSPSAEVDIIDCTKEPLRLLVSFYRDLFGLFLFFFPSPCLCLPRSLWL